MRAALVERLGEPPVVRELDEPEPRPGELLVEVAAAPLNPIDLSIASGRFYAGAPETPYVPGVEGLGRVLSGEGIEPGTRVYVESGGGRRLPRRGGPRGLASARVARAPAGGRERARARGERCGRPARRTGRSTAGRRAHRRGRPRRRGPRARSGARRRRDGRLVRIR